MKKLICFAAIFLATSGSAFAGAYMNAGGGSVVNWASVSQTVANLCTSAVTQNATINQSGGGAATNGGAMGGGAQQGGTTIPVGVWSSVGGY